MIKSVLARLTVVAVATLAAALLIAGCGSDSGTEPLPNENTSGVLSNSAARNV